MSLKPEADPRYGHGWLCPISLKPGVWVGPLDFQCVYIPLYYIIIYMVPFRLVVCFVELDSWTDFSSSAYYIFYINTRSLIKICRDYIQINKKTVYVFYAIY